MAARPLEAVGTGRQVLVSWFAPPSSSQPPVETLRWARRMEITMSIALLAGAAVVWSNEWWSWLLLGIGLFGLSPWPGPGALVRKAETRPEILVSDPERRRRRARQALKILVPAQVAILTGAGYVLLGWGGAAFLCVVALVSGALAAWLLLKMEP